MKTLSAFSSLLFLASIARGQAPSTSPFGGKAPAVNAPGMVRPREFGVGIQNAYTVAADATTPLVSDTTYGYTDGLARYRTGGSLWFQGQMQLPSGALLTGFELDGCDTSATATVDAWLYACANSGGACAAVAEVSTGNAQTPGCNFYFSSIAGHTVNQLDNSYSVSVALTGIDSKTSFQSVRVYWQRQLSPAPADPTFGDVPKEHPFYRVIEALSASGVTSGCGNGNFCPEGVVTRQELAKFLARALGLAYNDGFVF